MLYSDVLFEFEIFSHYYYYYIIFGLVNVFYWSCYSIYVFYFCALV